MVPPQAVTQGGVFTRRQALAAGIPASTISARLARGRWLRLLPQVYGLRPANCATLVQAATLWLPRGTVSHLAAAWLWGLFDEPRVVHLTVPLTCTRRSPHDWLRLVRRDVEPDQRWELFGIPVVPPERAVLDCCAVLDRPAATPLVDRALFARFSLPDFRGRYWSDLGVRGSRHAYHRLVAAVPGAASQPELVLARAAWRAGLRGLRVNQPVLGFVADLLDPDLRLVVEVDGYRNHSDREAFHRDRVRQNTLVAAGYTVLRFTATQALHDTARVVSDIAAVATRLAARGA
ncbi:MAG TPA: type IV toxin-antitoxin system AbiEi family antitoxin domain-containing protein [Pseudonocardiaceae bacterium]